MGSQKNRESPPPIQKIVDPPIVGSISEVNGQQEENDENKLGNYFDMSFNNTIDSDKSLPEVDKITSVPFLGKQQNEFN